MHSIQVDWETEAVAVTTCDGVDDLERKLAHRTVTSGCGQGTVFGRISDYLDRLRLPAAEVRQSRIYDLLERLSAHNEVYKRAGAVHGCALCAAGGIELFVEDVGRHNAADAIAGHMWLNAVDGADKLFYTTGRLTSEMVIKTAQMGIPALVSRSGFTAWGVEIARQVGLTLLGRMRGQRFVCLSGEERLLRDADPGGVNEEPARHRRKGARDG